MPRNPVKDALLGLAVGDALGVPVEFMSRQTISENPVTDMRAYGTHNQPGGTWSDDSSLTFCLAEMLCNEYDLDTLARHFVNWKENAYWTAHDEVFDIGIATTQAINLLKKGTSALFAGGHEEHHNGNGSLMRILPLLFYTRNKTIEKRFNYVTEVSSLTHRHIISIVSCFIYLEYALKLLNGTDKFLALELTRIQTSKFLTEKTLISDEYLHKFKRVLTDKYFDKLDESVVYSSGYVLHTLEASIWCILNTNDYKDAVLKAVNLGQDTDTTGAVTGAGRFIIWLGIHSS